MVECNSIDSPNIYPVLNDQQFKQKKINEIRYYFITEIKERELMIKILSKCIASINLISL